MNLKSAVPFLTFAVVAAVMAFQAFTPETTLAEIAWSVNGCDHLPEIPGYSSEALAPSEAELNVLPADTVLERRNYTAEDGRSGFQVSVVVGGRSKSSIHRPELCLPAQGFQMRSPRTLTVDGVDWRVITLSSKATPDVGFAYTFVNQDGRRTASHTARIFRDVLDRSLYNRIDRWVMVTVNAGRSDDAGIAEVLAKVKVTVGE